MAEEMKKLLSLQNLADYKALEDAKIAADILVETQRAKGVEGALTDLTTDAKTSLVAAINELDSHVDTNTTAIGVEPAEGVTGSGLKKRVKDLEDAVGSGGSVDTKIKNAIDALDADKKSADVESGKGLQVQVVQVDGKIDSVSLTGDFDSKYDALNAASTVKSEVIGASTDAKTADTIYGAKAYADDAVSTLDGTLAAVAKSGAAADVTVADASDKITATNVEGALLEIVNKADANATAISTINGEGEGSIKKAVKDLKESLDKEDTAVDHQFVTAVSETDGVITVSRAALTADDIPTLTLSKISDAGTAAASDVATTAIASDTTDASLVTAAQVAKFVKDEVADLEGATHFRGTFTKLEDVTNPKNGDIAIVGVKEYIYVKPTAESTGEWKELGDESIYVTKTTTIAGVDLENNITKEELLTALNVADGAQVNVLEGVQVNGTDLSITDKKVNVTVATGSASGTIAVNGVDVTVKDIAGAAFKAEDYYEVAGTAQSKIEALDATITTVTESDPTPVVNISISETDGKLSAVSASIKAETFDSYGSAAAVQNDLDAYKYTVAQKTEIEALFEESTQE